MVTFDNESLKIEIKTVYKPHEYYNLLLKSLTNTLRCKQQSEKELGHDESVWILYDFLEELLPSEEQTKQMTKAKV